MAPTASAISITASSSGVLNIALILGLAALLRPAKVEAKILRVDASELAGVLAYFS